MTTAPLDTIRTHIISMICHETSEKVLNDVELLLRANHIPPMSGYSSEALKNAVLRSEDDIRNGRTHTIEEVRKRFPIP